MSRKNKKANKGTGGEDNTKKPALIELPPKMFRRPMAGLMSHGEWRLQTAHTYNGEPPQLLLLKPPYNPEEVLDSLERAARDSLLLWGQEVTCYMGCDAATFRQNLVDHIAVARKALARGDHGTAMGIIWNVSRQWGVAYGRASHDQGITTQKVRRSKDSAKGGGFKPGSGRKPGSTDDEIRAAYKKTDPNLTHAARCHQAVKIGELKQAVKKGELKPEDMTGEAVRKRLAKMMAPAPE